MKVGVRVPPAPPFARMRRLVERLAEGGADSFWWADHLMAFSTPSLWEDDDPVPDERSLHSYADPFVCMAACAESLGDADAGTCVTDAIRRMPATLLQSALSIDHLVAGRVILGLGAGEVSNYRPYGWNVTSPADRLEAAARSIRGLMDDPGPDPNGAIMGLPPASPNGPELWLAAHGKRGFGVTGRYAEGWIPTNLGADDWTTGRDAVLAAAREANREADAVEMALSLDIVVQDTHEQAHSLLRHPAIRSICLLLPVEVFRRYGSPHPLGGSALSTLVATVSDNTLLNATREIPDRLVHDCVVHGPPDDIAAKICAYPELRHVRLSDLSGVAHGRTGGVERLLTVIALLHLAS